MSDTVSYCIHLIFNHLRLAYKNVRKKKRSATQVERETVLCEDRAKLAIYEAVSSASKLGNTNLNFEE